MFPRRYTKRVDGNMGVGDFKDNLNEAVEKDVKKG